MLILPSAVWKENLVCVFLRPKCLADVLRIHGEFVVNLYIVELILESKHRCFFPINYVKHTHKKNLKFCHRTI